MKYAEESTIRYPICGVVLSVGKSFEKPIITELFEWKIENRRYEGKCKCGQFIEIWLRRSIKK